jgi:hypothetical protein
MSGVGAGPSGEGELPAAPVRLLERACDRFEAACQAGLRPRAAWRRSA